MLAMSNQNNHAGLDLEWNQLSNKFLLSFADKGTTSMAF
jgi:hypothetical protein